MPGFGDSAFIVILALLLFGPKKLPVLARQLGKLMADFRRASNEFRSQMEEELRISEQADRQKEVAALEAANKIAPPAELHTPPDAPNFASAAEGEIAPGSPTEFPAEDTRYPETSSVTDDFHGADASFSDSSEPAPAPEPAPIATSGDLTIMPPETGLPIARSPRSTPGEDQAQLSFGESQNLPAESPAREAELETETLHG